MWESLKKIKKKTPKQLCVFQKLGIDLFDGKLKTSKNNRHILIALLPDNKRVDVVIFMDIMLSAYMCLFIQRNIQIIHLDAFKMHISFS